ncbi:MAG: DUF6259 domain-containing protein, partial [Candidatus Baldrarchaeia archaeon]
MFSGVYFEEDSDFLYLSNNLIEIVIAKANGGVYGIRNLLTGHDFISSPKVKLFKNASIWRVKLKDKTGEKISITNEADNKFSYEIEEEKARKITLHLFWKNKKNNLDIHAAITASKESNLTYWQIDVASSIRNVTDQNLWIIEFPYLSGIGPISEDKNKDYLSIPWMSGKLLANPLDYLSKNSIRGTYPGLSLQFFSYYGERGGLYLAAYDPEVYPKAFVFEPDDDEHLSYRLQNFPENMGLKKVYNMPYPAVVGVFNGDWITAAQIYRDWALKQPWCSKGPLETRSDFPEWLKSISLWVWNRGKTEKVGPPVIALQQYLGLPVGIAPWHWWHNNPYDTHLPEYYPPREGDASFKEGINKLHKSGIRMTPYINSVYWDTQIEEWKEAEKYSAKNYALKPYITVFCTYTKAPLAIMCSFTEFWQNKVSDLVSKVVNEYDVDGAYLDCLPSNPLCFDPEHGHPVGGGNYFYAGYKRMIDKIRHKAKKKDIMLSAEGCHEAYIDLLEGFLVYDEIFIHRNKNLSLIPLFQFIYHGYAITYGAYTPLDGVPPYDELWSKERRPKHKPIRLLSKDYPYQFAWELGNLLVSGSQLTFTNYYQELVGKTEYGKDLAYVKNLAKTYFYGRKYLLYGQMMRPLELEVPSIEVMFVPYRSIYSRPEEIVVYKRKIPAILSSTWKASDGSLGFVFVNITENPITLEYEVDLKEYGLPENCIYDVYIVDPNGRRH